MWDIAFSGSIALLILVGSTLVLDRYTVRRLDLRVLIWFLGILYSLLANCTPLVAVPFDTNWFLRLIAPCSMILTSCSFVLAPYSLQDILLMLGFGIGYPLLFDFFLSGGAIVLKSGNSMHQVDYIVLGSMMAAVYPVYVLKIATENARTPIYNLMVGETVFGTAICVLLAQTLTQGHSLISTFPIVMWRYILSIAIGVMTGLASGKFINRILDSVCCCLIPYQRYVDFFALCAGLPVGILFAILAIWFNVTLNSPLAIFSSIVAFFYVKPIESSHRMPRISALFDAIVFLYLGATAFHTDIWNKLRYSVVEVFIAMTLLSALHMLVRLVLICIILNVYNMRGRSPISIKEMMVLWFAGLTKGGPSLAISYLWFATSTSDSGVFMISTTLFLVHISLFVFGLCTRYVLKRSITLYQWLGWSRGSPEQLSPDPLPPDPLPPEPLSPESLSQESLLV